MRTILAILSNSWCWISHRKYIVRGACTRITNWTAGNVWVCPSCRRTTLRKGLMPKVSVKTHGVSLAR